MDHLILSQQLNTFSFEYHKSNNDFSITDETKKRIILSRLYYALLNRLFNELPEVATSKGSNKHESVLNILKKQAGNGNFYSDLLNLLMIKKLCIN